MNKTNFLNIGDSRFYGVPEKYIDYILKNQVKDRQLWKKFVTPFKNHSDVANNGWRGEYFGKMMRGACLVYAYVKDDELYDILTEAVKDMLSAQDSLGRFSSYDVKNEFRGWDVWGRKYVATGLLHYVDICKDDSFKTEIISALKKHFDYIIEKIGNGANQISITDTSDGWGAVNSCSILEPFIALYNITGEKRYLTFAEYIISTGGCKNGNLLECAKDNTLSPYMYPVVKTYEVMSFFEGVLAYYETTGKNEYLKVVENFVEKFNETEVTVIGSAGCLDELMNNAAVVQTERTDERMQETCVTVTWMRLLTRMYKNSGDSKYIDRFEKASLNAFCGAINLYNVKTYVESRNITIGPFPFDSYSPIYNNKRGRAVGGYQCFEDGSAYGCCACIGAAGVGLIPLVSVMERENGVVFNEYYDGEFIDKNANRFKIEGGYPSEFTIKITAENINVKSNLFFRVPDWSDGFDILLNGNVLSGNLQHGYFVYDGEINTNDVFTVSLHGNIKACEINGLVYWTYGPLVLARDNRKDGHHFLYRQIDLGVNADEAVFERKDAVDPELVRFESVCSNGNRYLLTDYASCGKLWDDFGQKISVFCDVKKY